MGDFILGGPAKGQGCGVFHFSRFIHRILTRLPQLADQNTFHFADILPAVFGDPNAIFGVTRELNDNHFLYDSLIRITK